MLYPFPDFFSDSYSYIYAASVNLDVNIWPIGYSKFLRWFHFITYSDVALVTFQYFFLEISVVFFYFSMLYFYPLGKTTANFLLLFLFYNPLFLYISNYVNSDPLFAALSILWFTTLLWIIYKPRLYQLFTHGILLFCCFSVRNNAYYYPIVSVVALLLSRQALLLKLIGILVPLCLVVPFIIHTRNEAFKLTGDRQFSLFTGWQLANNALYCYQDLSVETSELPSSQSQELDKIVKQFNNRIRPEFYENLPRYVGNFFIREPKSPLKQYLFKHYNVIDDYSSLVAWGKSSVIFNEYGEYLIKQNPTAFIRDFMIPNVRNYVIPPLEKLEIYNLGTDNVWPIAQEWFHYPSEKINVVSNKAQGTILFFFPAFFLVMNLIFTCSLMYIWLIKKAVYINDPNKKRTLLIVILLTLNFGFSVFATINVFRYQFFPLIIIAAITAYFIQIISEPKTIIARQNMQPVLLTE